MASKVQAVRKILNILLEKGVAKSEPHAEQLLNAAKKEALSDAGAYSKFVKDPIEFIRNKSIKEAEVLPVEARDVPERVLDYSRMEGTRKPQQSRALEDLRQMEPPSKVADVEAGSMDVSDEPAIDQMVEEMVRPVKFRKTEQQSVQELSDTKLNRLKKKRKAEGEE